MNFTKTVTDTGEQRELAKTGLTIGILISLVDVGTQKSNNPEFTDKREVKATFEIPSQRTVFDKENGEQPFVITVTYSDSLHVKSAMYKAFSGMNGKDLEGAIDLSTFIGKSYMINIGVTKSGKSNRIESYAPLMEGMEAKTPENPTYTYQIGDPVEAYDKLPKWMQNVVAQSPEYKRLAITGATNVPGTTFP